MVCPECDAETVAITVPGDLREHAAAATGSDDADGPSTVAACTNCLRIYETAGADADSVADRDADVGAVSDALPADEGAATALLLAAALLESVASNRRAVEVLIDRVERAGVDPALAIERLADDPDLAPAVDLRRRYGQFDQLR